jgi:hypothetical protein
VTAARQARSALSSAGATGLDRGFRRHVGFDGILQRRTRKPAIFAGRFDR